MLAAICVGHSRLVNGHPEGGAVAIDETTSELSYNTALAAMICLELDTLGMASTGIYRYPGNGYGAAQRWLAGELKALGATLAIELHFNSSDSPASNGHEMLYWHASVKGKALAAAIDAQFDSLLPAFRHRPLVAITAQDRGAQFLRGTHCPAVIVESFFGSNAGDWREGMARRATIARAIACGIRDYLGKS